MGPEIIQDDPHKQSQNGKLLASIVDRHELYVINADRNKCEGLITRRRATKDNIEESIIDFVITNAHLQDEVESLLIDEKRNHILSKITKTKKGVKIQESDHHPLITKLKFTWSKHSKNDRKEIFNFKNKDCQNKFKDLTTQTKELSKIMMKNEDLNISTKKFIKRLDGFILEAFNKIRISDRKNDKIGNLLDKRRALKNKHDEESKKELDKVEIELADKCAEENRRKIIDQIEGLECNDGGVNSGRLWKLRKKLFPRSRDPPTAMLDTMGNLVTNPKVIEEMAIKTFTDRLKNKPIKEGLENVKKDKEELCRKRLEKAKNSKTEPWKIEDLEAVLKFLKKNKSKDPFGYVNEIFDVEVAGDDLKLAMLILMNRIKTEQVYPKVLELCDITPIFKLKGSRNEFTNYRGIFRVSVFRSILDRLIYNDEYHNIDRNLTDCNVGARKGRNIRDNIFVLNAITNSVIKGGEQAIDIQVFDVKTCFDSLWLQECINDAYEAGMKNDKLPLLYLENLNAKVAVKTAKGISTRINIQNLIMQGSVFGGLLCTTSMDKLGKLVYEEEKLIYKYKEAVDVPSLCMVDDVLTVQKCSTSSIQMNSVVNSFMELKKLTLSDKKCSKIHIGKRNMNCHKLKVHDKFMKDSNQERYLGDQIRNDAKVKATIDDRVGKGYGIVTEINTILEEIPLGRYRVEIGLKLREAMLINGLLFNSEAWHSVEKDDIKRLEKIDELLLRSLMGSHQKTPIEFLYLETGSLPISHIISLRRMNYLRILLMRDDKELTKRILIEQQKNPTKGDFIELVKEDFMKIGKNFDKTLEEFITHTQEKTYKKIIKNLVKSAALKLLINVQQKHTKVKHIKYDVLKCEKYLTSGIFSNEEITILSSMRSNTLRTIRCNFKNLYRENLYCPLKCAPEGSSPYEDTQQHLISCNTIIQKLSDCQTIIAVNTIKYEDIYSDIYQ